MSELCVTVATHHFVVTRVNPRARPAVDNFARMLILRDKMARGNAPSKADKVFCFATNNRHEWRFHINHLEQFKENLKKYFIHDGMVDWKVRPIVEAPDIILELKKGTFEPYDYQVPVIEYIVREGNPISRLVNLQTGKGKTYCMLKGGHVIKKRIVMIIKPKYVDLWIKAFKDTYDIKDKELCVISGSKPLMSLLNMAADGNHQYKVIIISNATYRNWLSLYKEFHTETLDMGYACLPQDLFDHLQAGFRAIDEVHEDFHLNFLCDLFTHVPRSLSLSATLLSDNDFILRMMKTAYPPSERYEGGEYDKYVNSFFLTYRFNEPERIRTSEYGQTTYSHHCFEQSVIKQPQVLQNYFEMVNRTMQQTYFKNYLPGQRCLIYCTSIDMCTRLTEWLKKLYPQKDIRRYVEDDPYENIMEAEISVSTVQSAGTGLDIKMLATVILTSAVNSSQSNIQGFGRLRKPKDGWVPEFVYFVCEDIIKHWDYHEKKDLLLAGRALSNAKRVYTTLI